jgi:hypothetical protein
MEVALIAFKADGRSRHVVGCGWHGERNRWHMAVTKSLDRRKRPALKRRAKQQKPVNRPEKARRASLISPTVYRRAFAAGEELTLQQP